ncbi:MAG: POTRA domain-containing protein [Bryobacteraceae bacterium]|nr:POTRA domain-containing protein [Bryobacteraceae bacterium]
MFRTAATALSILALTAPAQTPPRRPASPPAAVKKKGPAAAPARQEQQVIVDPSAPFPVEKILVTGNKQFSDTEIIRMTGLQPGQLVRKPDFDAAQQRLLESGLFETVAYRYAPQPGSKSYLATFEVKEVGQAFVYKFESIELPEAEMRAYLKQAVPMFGDRIPATAPVLKRFTDALEKFTASKNKPLELVGKLMPDSKGQLEIVFQPSSLPSIAQVNFAGNKVISTPALQQAVAGAAVGAIYTEPRFRQILDASIRPLYEAQGYLSVKFPKIETTQAQDVRGVNTKVEVQEGAVYKLREVVIGGEMADNARLAKEGSFRINEVVDMNAVGEGAKRIERYLKRRGYLNAEAKITRKLNDKDHTVDITADVDPGPQYRMGRLDLVGLDITTEPHIRKMWALGAKAPFDFEYPDIFIKEMPNVLDSTGRMRPTVKPDSGTLTVDVIITFSPEEKQPGPSKRRIPDQGERGTPAEFPL